MHANQWFTAVAFVLSCVSAVLADTIRVPGDAPTIQIAIQLADPFDTIIVAPNTYFEAISFAGKVIAIQSEDPNDPDTVANTIIDAGGLGIVVTFSGSEGDIHSTLNGLTITGGTSGIEGNSTQATIQNCVIRDNASFGIIRADGTIRNCKVTNNGSTGLNDCDGTITGCLVDRNGQGLFGCGGTVSDCRVTRSTSSSTGNGFNACHGRIERCLVSNHRSYGLRDCNAYVVQSIISGNSFDGFFRCHGPLIENCVIAGNKRDGFNQCSWGVLNCTVTGNIAFGFRSHTGFIEQAIIWDNTGGALSGSTTPILSGTVNPFFIQPGHWDNISNIWIEGDYHVAPDSPYIDAGSPLYGDDPNDPELDLDGNPRVIGARVDIGAYEFQAPCEGSDFDGDGTPDICDPDIDNDGITNTLDACDFTPTGIPVNLDGRPLADLNLDCDVDLRDYARFQLSMFGTSD